MNPIRTFKPTVGAHVHDTLNNMWMTLTAEDVADMERSRNNTDGRAVSRIGMATFSTAGCRPR
jgi:hypothetical protein